MPRRRRPLRPVRRHNFQAAPEPQTDDEDAPIFGEEPPGAIPLYGSTGPVETRPHWMARNERVQGRRLQQIRRSSGTARGTARPGTAGQLPMLDRAYISQEMRRILITTAALAALIVVLAIVLR